MEINFLKIMSLQILNLFELLTTIQGGLLVFKDTFAIHISNFNDSH